MKLRHALRGTAAGLLLAVCLTTERVVRHPARQREGLRLRKLHQAA